MLPPFKILSCRTVSLYNTIMNYENYMKKCIQLAELGVGKVSPNPLVGCIILNENNNIISSGYHAAYGKNHAERDALLKIKQGAGHTLIVNLEPCSHFGLTPPCTDIIIEKGIKRVVFGMRDVNPKVSGADILKDAGIEVIEGILEDECRKLNEIYIKNMTEQKAFVAIKTAATLDGKIATSTGSSKWITSENARDEVKNIRKKYDAILTTASTILADNPKMEHRKKIIIDRKLKTDFSSDIYKSGEIYVFHDENLNPQEVEHINFVPAPVKNMKLDIDFILDTVFQIGIKSVLIEAGGKFAGSALKYADKIYHFIAPKIVGDNSAMSCFDYRKVTDISDAVVFEIQEIKNFAPDIMLTYYPTEK